ncbi:MAG: XRE family transcriptional regulator [Dehalococcoidia bacterium]|nr:XRE family transcriptional regulator [Dehalococcoidia bacterium]
MTTPPSDSSESLHSLLARARSERRLSIAQLAASTRLSPNAVRWIERGITQPKPESLWH